MTKQKIVKIAFNEILIYGVDHINIKNLANRTGLNIEKLNTLFQHGDKELQIDAVEYAGKMWVSQIKKKIQDSHNISDKLEILACGYTMGSKDFSQSLSTYIDLWKIVKDQKDEYIKMRLKSIYNFYISEFVNIVTDIGCRNISKKELNSFAVMMTILSDVIHIQSVTLGNEIDFDSLSSVICKITKQFLKV